MGNLGRDQYDSQRSDFLAHAAGKGDDVGIAARLFGGLIASLIPVTALFFAVQESPRVVMLAVFTQGCLLCTWALSALSSQQRAKTVHQEPGSHVGVALSASDRKERPQRSGPDEEIGVLVGVFGGLIAASFSILVLSVVLKGPLRAGTAVIFGVGWLIWTWQPMRGPAVAGKVLSRTRSYGKRPLI